MRTDIEVTPRWSDKLLSYSVRRYPNYRLIKYDLLLRLTKRVWVLGLINGGIVTSKEMYEIGKIPYSSITSVIKHVYDIKRIKRGVYMFTVREKGAKRYIRHNLTYGSPNDYYKVLRTITHQESMKFSKVRKMYAQKNIVKMKHTLKDYARFKVPLPRIEVPEFI